MKKPELLLPAGNLDTLKTAIAYGADAVYIGGEAFSLRAKADNFDKETMTEAIGFAHAHGVKVYVTVNIFAHNADIDKAGPYLRELAGIRPDALIISDPGLFMMAKELAPGIDIHVSTQMNSTNYEAFLFWYRLGAKRVVNARELSLAELKEIRSRIPEDMEIESFVHGAMCISYSGRCLLSGYMTGRSANLGACTHPCRWNYAVMEEKRPGEYFPVEEDERGTYIFNSRDLCMIEHIPELIEAGVDSFKVEGRMKTQLYVAAAARAYRNAIDDYFTDPELYRRRIPLYKEEIGKCTYREFTTGFYFGKPNEEAQIYDSNTYVKNYTFLGSVAEVLPDGSVRIEQKNKFCTGDEIEILKKDLTSVFAKVLRIRDAATGADQESCPHSRQQLLITLTGTPEVYDILCVRSKEQ
ncbi:MAG: U32 family peptidase [Lachnospiraceae bacterium]|nr:U32 family peptidase [Lachnospiraceae bacterium]MBQ2040898.1 U32 family peptidase [Lachnospiraceae bacterium]